MYPIAHHCLVEDVISVPLRLLIRVVVQCTPGSIGNACSRLDLELGLSLIQHCRPKERLLLSLSHHFLDLLIHRAEVGGLVLVRCYIWLKFCSWRAILGRRVYLHGAAILDRNFLLQLSRLNGIVRSLTPLAEVL